MGTKIIIVASFLSIMTYSQNKNTMSYFAEIAEYPETYSSNLLVARMIDGLGFRYYWATEGLRNEDLQYKASETGRSSLNTIEHIYGLSKFIRNSILETNKDSNNKELSFSDMRFKTFENLMLVSEMFKNRGAEFEFASTSIPFWNLINGPISDALWHTGQVTMMRRASGNPFNSNVSVFAGKLKQ